MARPEVQPTRTEPRDRRLQQAEMVRELSASFTDSLSSLVECKPPAMSPEELLSLRIRAGFLNSLLITIESSLWDEGPASALSSADFGISDIVRWTSGFGSLPNNRPLTPQIGEVIDTAIHTAVESLVPSPTNRERVLDEYSGVARVGHDSRAFIFYYKNKRPKITLSVPT